MILLLMTKTPVCTVVRDTLTGWASAYLLETLCRQIGARPWGGRTSEGDGDPTHEVAERDGPPVRDSIDSVRLSPARIRHRGNGDRAEAGRVDLRQVDLRARAA